MLDNKLVQAPPLLAARPLPNASDAPLRFRCEANGAALIVLLAVLQFEIYSGLNN